MGASKRYKTTMIEEFTPKSTVSAIMDSRVASEDLVQLLLLFHDVADK